MVVDCIEFDKIDEFKWLDAYIIENWFKRNWNWSPNSKIERSERTLNEFGELS